MSIIPTERRRRSRAVAAPALAAFAAVSIAACGASGPDYQGACRDNKTGKRLDDSQCDKNGGTVAGHSWVYVPVGGSVPPVGSGFNAGGYTDSVPAGKSAARGGAPAKGGSVARGGFGGDAHGGGPGGK